MTLWLLVVIFIVDGSAYMHHGGLYGSMDECFDEWEIVMQTAPQPKINYEAICIQTDQAGEI
jgi:hypothetical protein